jgi:cytochrome b
MSENQCTHVKVWDLPTRLFHWINFLAIISLIFLGMIMLFKKDLGISGLDAKIALKELHILVGYVFVLNLLWRLLWGFMGNRYARWKNILPGKGYRTELKSYMTAMKSGEPRVYAGHNPLGRLAVSFILLLMMVIAASGLIRAGTDVYFPPFGSSIASYIAADGVDPESLKPYDNTGVDKEKSATLKSFKGPFGEIHQLAAYALIAMILLHIFFVVFADIKEGNGMVSAMFTGKKILRKPPADQ